MALADFKAWLGVNEDPMVLNSHMYTLGQCAVVAYGHPFTGIKRPRGYRMMKKKQCFGNAYRVALAEKRGLYCEGFAMSSGTRWPIQHAWITLDETHAIDVTWDDPEQSSYFGISIPINPLATFFLKTDTVGGITSAEHESHVKPLLHSIGCWPLPADVLAARSEIRRLVSSR
jgi:hypothetical protein